MVDRINRSLILKRQSRGNHMRFYALLTLFFFTIIPVRAELLVTAPDKACILLNEIGLTTSGWKNEYDQFGCESGYKQLGSSVGLANNLAFYLEGNSSSVELTYLMLNINDRTSASSAHQELLRAAEVLSIKETGKKLSKQLKAAISKGTSASEKIGKATIDIARYDWPTGRGYDVKVSIK